MVLTSDLLLSGLVYGWAPLQLMMPDEQQYAELCSDDSPLVSSGHSGFVCVKQENKLNLMFAVASVAMNVASPPIGVFLDYAGTTKAVAMAAVVEISGLVLMAFADSRTFDVFLPAYSMLALGGCLTMMASYPASFVLVEYQTVVLADIYCLFDGSSAVFLILYSLQSTYELTRQQLFIGLALLSGVVYLLLIALWYANESSVAGESSSKAKREQCETHVDKPNAAYGVIVDHSAPNDTLKKQLQLELEALQLVNVPLRKQIMSTEFLYIVVFSTTQMLCSTIYIGTTNNLLECTGDGGHGYLYTKNFSGVLPMGFLFVQLHCGGERLGAFPFGHEWTGRGVQCVVPDSQSACAMSCVLPLHKIPLVHVRCTVSLRGQDVRAFEPWLESPNGITFSVGAVMNLLEYPAVYISNEYLGGDLTAVYGVTLFLCTALIPYTLYLLKHERIK